MLALLSPAKTLDYATERDLPPSTRPRLADAADGIARSASLLTVRRIADLMDVSDAIARLTAARFRGWRDAPERPAIQAFDGDVYTGLDAASMGAEDVSFAQDRIGMLSGMYGMLRPLDLMKPYRLEMGTKWSPTSVKLSDWWGRRVADLVTEDAARHGSNAVLNLASQEYWSVLKGRLPSGLRVMEVDFREADGRFITVHAKIARGAMARWMTLNRIDDIDAMRGFNSGGYAFDAATSTADRWTFRRSG